MDPVVSWLLRLALAALFLAAARHKIRNFVHFSAVLADYRLLPARMARPASGALVAAELCIGLGLAWPSAAAEAAFGGAGMLVLYSGAIAINLARGRREIVCGCGGDMDQTIHPGLLIRNAFLAAAALVAAIAPDPRTWTAVDSWSLGMGLIASALLWSAAVRLASFPLPWIPFHRRAES